MPGLRHLHWNGSALPGPVLEHLRKSRRTHLHLSLQADLGKIKQQARLQLHRLPTALKGVRSHISSLRIKLDYPCWAQLECRLLTQQPLKQLLLRSTRLRTLALDIDFQCPGDGDGIRCREYDYCGFGLSHGEALAPLEELEVVNYPWGRQLLSGWPAGWISWLGYPDPTCTEIEYWARNCDWSRLRCLRLHDDSIPLAAELAPQLTVLEDIEFRMTGDPHNWDQDLEGP
jgi:hypothetical protein